MAGNMNQMAASMVEGQARMGNDINKFSNPQRMMPFVP